MKGTVRGYSEEACTMKAVDELKHGDVVTFPEAHRYCFHELCAVGDEPARLYLVVATVKSDQHINLSLTRLPKFPFYGSNVGFHTVKALGELFDNTNSYSFLKNGANDVSVVGTTRFGKSRISVRFFRKGPRTIPLGSVAPGTFFYSEELRSSLNCYKERLGPGVLGQVVSAVDTAGSPCLTRVVFFVGNRLETVSTSSDRQIVPLKNVRFLVDVHNLPVLYSFEAEVLHDE